MTSSFTDRLVVPAKPGVNDEVTGDMRVTPVTFHISPVVPDIMVSVLSQVAHFLFAPSYLVYVI